MPYIPRDARALLDAEIGALADKLDYAPPGSLNYALTRLIHEWIGPSPRYADYNAAMGALECVKQELYRTRIAGYEDTAIIQNGPLPNVG